MAFKAPPIGSISSLLAPADPPAPTTPFPAHSTVPGAAVVNNAQNSRVDTGKGASSYTPPPSSQVSQPSRARTPTPVNVTSHLSSPPPTASKQSLGPKSSMEFTFTISNEQMSQASPEELRAMVADLLSTVHDAKTTAAHYKLQYQMLTMESAQAAERMHVEMAMAQREDLVLHTAEQQRQSDGQKTATQPVSDPNFRSVHVEVYNAMVLEIQELKSHNSHLDNSLAQHKKELKLQEGEIASLHDRILLMRERIRESRDHVNKYRNTPRTERSTPFQTPRVAPPSASAPEQQGFAALLHATDLLSQGAADTPSRGLKRTLSKAGHSVPSTPQRAYTKPAFGTFYTPANQRHPAPKVPQTEPIARKLNFKATPPSVRDMPVPGHESDGTVSASDDSEAETEIGDDVQARNSQGSRQILQGPTQGHGSKPPMGMVQGRLFGHVRKNAKDVGPGVGVIKE